MKAVNVDDVLKILHKYGKYVFVTDEKKYSTMVDEIANLKALKPEPILDKIKAEIESINLNEVATKYVDRFYGFQQETLAILEKYKAESEEDRKEV